MRLLPWAIAAALLVILWDTHQPAQAKEMPARFAAPGWVASTSIAGQTYGLKSAVHPNGEAYLQFWSPCGANGGFPTDTHPNGCALSGLQFCTYENGCEGGNFYSHETDAHERMARNFIFVWETLSEQWYKGSRTISAEGGELRIGSKLPGRGDTILVTREMPNRVPDLCDSDEERDRRAVSFLNDVLWYCGGVKGWGTLRIHYGE